MGHVAPKMKVYYNSGCPVCKAGIESQMDKGSSCEIEWADVHENNALASEVGARLEFVRERLHAVDDEGTLHVGFDAFLIIWRHSPSERWKARVLGLPVIKHLCRVAYNLFAAALYKWNRSKSHW
jgi:predicted DCC family thiol-disulfide oxidoreductase YuxK